ncbi:MAG: hypothetical protein NT087_08195 [Deltaproteobacteria bacterium]|nr:hypothetical protein [Deltaproteobacteria bacterium]
MITYAILDKQRNNRIVEFSEKNKIYDDNFLIIKRNILEKITGYKSNKFHELIDKINTITNTNIENKPKTLLIPDIIHLIAKYWVAISIAFTGYYIQKNFDKIINEITKENYFWFYAGATTIFIFYFIVFKYFLRVTVQTMNKIPFVGNTDLERIRVLLLDLSETATID